MYVTKPVNICVAFFNNDVIMLEIRSKFWTAITSLIFRSIAQNVGNALDYLVNTLNLRLILDAKVHEDIKHFANLEIFIIAYISH